MPIHSTARFGPGRAKHPPSGARKAAKGTNTMKSVTSLQPIDISRRKFLAGAATLTAAPLLINPLSAASAPATSRGTGPTIGGRRKLGALEVSSVGLGVQNMSR